MPHQGHRPVALRAAGNKGVQAGWPCRCDCAANQSTRYWPDALPTLTKGDRAWRTVKGSGIDAGMLFASEPGNRLAEQSCSFGLVWQLGADGEAKVSLRAAGNVAEIATNYGGGYPNAAGFRLPFARFASEILGKW